MDVLLWIHVDQFRDTMKMVAPLRQRGIISNSEDVLSRFYRASQRWQAVTSWYDKGGFFMNTNIESQEDHLDSPTRATWVVFLRYAYTVSVYVLAILWLGFTLWISLMMGPTG